MVTTPLAAWAARAKKIDTLMVTASHNPAGQNGLKVYSRDKGAISRENGLQEIENKFEQVVKGNLVLPTLPKKGTYQKKSFTQEYQKEILKIIGRVGNKSLRLALDYSNGTSGLVASEVLGRLGLVFRTLNEEPNGDFPGHGPNPLEAESQKKISWLLKNNRYSLGAIFDGDGDRIVFFDEKGEAIQAAHIFSVLCSFYLAKAKHNRSVVVTASISKGLNK